MDVINADEAEDYDRAIITAQKTDVAMTASPIASTSDFRQKNKKPFPGNDVSCGMNVKYTMWVVKIGINGPKRLKKCLFARYCTLNMPSYIENTIFL